MQIIKARCLAPVRLDKYLMTYYPTLNLGQLNKALRENKIKLNGKKAPLSTRVVAGDEIKLFISDEILEQKRAVSGPAWKAVRTGAEILHNDDCILIVNKPAGLPVDGSDVETLINRVLFSLNKLGEYAENSAYTPALCHRLDTGTSGLVIIAKTAAAERTFLHLIKERKIKKSYICVTFGRPSPPSGVLEGHLIKDAEKGVVKVISEERKGSKPVETHYETIAVSGRLALLKVLLVTGRTHQIRAHMESISCPILGDSKYGNNAANRELRLKYQALCAYELIFPDLANEAYSQVSGKTFKAPKPWYFEQIIDGTLK